MEFLAGPVVLIATATTGDGKVIASGTSIGYYELCL
jgi:hypothetical protein